MKISVLSQYLERLENTSSRLAITQILSDLFKESTPSDIDKTIYLLTGALGPKFDNTVFNLADKMVLKSLAEASNKDLSEVIALYKKTGDLGEVCNILLPKKESSKNVTDIFSELTLIAKDEGGGSQERKITSLSKLLKSLDRLSGKYIVRIVLGKLRLGFSDKTILDGLSWMEAGDKSNKKYLDDAYQVLPDVGILAKRVKNSGIIEATKNTMPIVGIPILPMLAQRLKSPKDMITKMGEVGVEPKLDGLRFQIHFKREPNGFVKAFTRNLNETSSMFPEMEYINTETKAGELIIDCEAVGVDLIRKRMVDFQSTMTRRRKHGIEEHKLSTPIKFFVFDVLFIDGKKIMDKDYLTRKNVLREIFKEDNHFVVVQEKITKDAHIIANMYTLMIKQGYEGIVVKSTTSPYIPGRTGWRWVKMKEGEASTGKLSDTMDCIIMGYTQGKGKRATFGMGQFLAGIRNGNRIVTITKVGTGLTDSQFRELKKRLSSITTKEKPAIYDVQKDYAPDYWVKPEIVVELAGDEITISPKHTSGFAIRFPRLVDFRDDKDINSATSLQEVKEIK